MSSPGHGARNLADVQLHTAHANKRECENCGLATCGTDCPEQPGYGIVLVGWLAWPGSPFDPLPCNTVLLSDPALRPGTRFRSVSRAADGQCGNSGLSRSFFECVHYGRVLSRVAGPCADVTEVQSLQQGGNVALVIRDAEALLNHALQINAAPADHAVLVKLRSAMINAESSACWFAVRQQTGLVTILCRSGSDYASLASKARGLMPPRYEWRRRGL